MGSREEPGRDFTENGLGIPELVGLVPTLILYYRACSLILYLDSTGRYYPTVTKDHL